jgi:hypothetical protein
MASCEDDFELSKFSCYIGRIYGPSLSMHLGKKHDYLGVDMEFCDNGALEVSMIKYLRNVINKFPELIKGQAATPAHDKLFVIRDDGEARKLNEEQALAFHFPPHGGAVVVHGNEGETRYSDGGGFPHDKGERPG